MTSSCEVWKDVTNFGGRYQVSNLGRVRNIERAHLPNGGILMPDVNRSGYHLVHLQRLGRERRVGIHRLVAEEFIPNTAGKPQVNHKDGNKSNNTPDNLEWVTCSENNLHRRRVLNGGGGRPPRPVICLDTREWFPSITEAAIASGAYVEKILECCKGRRNKTAGLRWAYAEEVEVCEP